MKKSYAAQIDKLTKELEDAKKRNVTIANKPAATGMEDVEVLEKSRKAPQRLSKSETMSYLHSLQRQGDRRIEVRDITNLNLVKTDAELATYQDSLKKRGIQLPEL
jgi:tripartite-type tricarboxylate transporter receptor subunit TctC